MNHAIDENRLPVDPTLHTLQHHLSTLVSAWQDVAADPLVQATYVKLYHETMLRMVEQGWDPTIAKLDEAARLTDVDMPAAYLRQMRGEQYDWRPTPAIAELESVLHARHPIDADGVPLDPQLAALERALGRLAEEWRRAIALPARRRAVVATYHVVMERMFELGWDGLLNPYSELPDRWMPPEYGRRLGRRRNDHSRISYQLAIWGVELTNERLLFTVSFSDPASIPLSRLPTVYAASPDQRDQWRLTEDCQAIEWPKLGVTVSLRSLSDEWITR